MSLIGFKHLTKIFELTETQLQHCYKGIDFHGTLVIVDDCSPMKLPEPAQIVDETPLWRWSQVVDVCLAIREDIDQNQVMVGDITPEEAKARLADISERVRQINAKLNPTKEQLEQRLEENPSDLTALNKIAFMLHKEGAHEDGLAYDRRIVALTPASKHAQYNLGCRLALTGRNDEAFKVLKLAVKYGATAQELSDDSDFRNLHHDSRWQNLLKAAEDTAAP